LTQRRVPQWPAIILSIALVAIGAFTVISGIRGSVQQDRIIGCVAGYSNALADSLEQRAKASQDAQAALDQVMETVATGFDNPSPAAGVAVRKAIDNYVTLRKTSREAQAHNPYPAPPRDVCSDLLN
jgi:hypothetical protein